MAERQLDLPEDLSLRQRDSEPVSAGDLGAVEGDLLCERPIGALDDVALRCTA
jgi:hypothetical protein